MTVTYTQRHNPAESINERTSGRRIDAVQQFISLRVTETGNTDVQGKISLTHTPIGSLARQFDNLSRINEKPDLVATKADDTPLYPGEFDLDTGTIMLYTNSTKTTKAENLVGVKVSYWYYAPIQGVLNDDGTFTLGVAGNVQLTGSNAFQSGNPYPIAKDCVAANTNYDIDVNAGLTRNGHFGLIQAHENNTGVVSVWISFNGTTFTASAIARLQAGDALSLDGLDINTIRVQSTVAGDSVVGGVW